ncbi:MAG: ABC transporter ATP-binding protein [Euryarchaeota archaeon]|nr:ABC transporter ATP-binding protein [Euryarchaeota archaeon]|tara:strand:- start:302 stop:1144 length:843 start_codon:yes stop_codon:yes gene_type:complete
MRLGRRLDISGDKMEQIQITVDSPSLEGETVLEVKDLSVTRSGKLVLKDINLEIKTGEFVGLVGPNGSGKSTLMLSILGILKAQKGSVRIYGSPPMSRNQIGKIGWVSQAAANLKKEIRITVEELVKLGTINAKNMFFRSRKEQYSAVENAIRMVGMEELRNTDVSKLSGGQRQRAVIARALASNADFILLDEPLVGIDRDARNSLLKLLDNLCHDEGKTILMVSHDLAAIRQTAHRMIFLEQGIWFDGSSEDFPDLNELANLRGIQHVHEHSDYKEDEG